MAVAGGKDDPFSGLRRWCKVWTQDLTDVAWVQLTYEQRGIYDDLLKFSLRASDTPGFFLYDDVPMDVDTMIRGLAPSSHEEATKIAAALQALREAKLLAYDELEGWSIVRWRTQQPATIVEAESATKQRIGNAKRQRTRRAGAPEGGSAPPAKPRFSLVDQG